MKYLSVYSQACFSVLFLLLFSSVHGQWSVNSSSNHSTNEKAEEIDVLVSKYADYGEFNGSILVSKGGSVVYQKGFGMANMEWKVPNQTNTKFRIGSITKQFTAMLIMQLVAENKIALDERISAYLPDYHAENADRITIHHLLTHSSGIPNSYESTIAKPIRPDSYATEKLIAEFSALPLEFEPGEKFSYCNAGYTLLGHIVEVVTGRTYEEVLNGKIFKPLKMENTGFDKHRALIENRASGYFKAWGDYFNSNYIDMSKAYAAGGLYSTVEDMKLWDDALYTSNILLKKYLDLTFTKQISDSAYGAFYGYGWEMKEKPIGNTTEKMLTFGHDGVIDGFCAIYTRIPEVEGSIIILSNVRRAPLNAMTKGIMGILSERTYDFPKASVAYSLLDIINTDGAEAGISHFEEVSRKSTYYLSEDEINIVSYKLLQTEKISEAAEVLKLGISAFPSAFNLYDSYGEVLISLGDKEESIRNYKKSLELNPENENAIKKLEELGVIINKEDLYILKSYKDWGKELFTFPLNFAPDLKFTGTEEAHFTPGWRKADSPEFWSYAFVWNISGAEPLEPLDGKKLEVNIQVYFDGLMEGVNKSKDMVPPKTAAKLAKNEESVTDHSFIGTVEIFDAFVTNKTLVLNVKIEQEFCEKTGMFLIIYRFSPSVFDSEVWIKLNKVRINDNVCD